MTADLVIYGAGPRDPLPLDPAEIQFKAEPRKSCRCCLFHGQWVNVCNQAAEVAAMRGMPNCDDGVIYVVPDARQMDILKSEGSSDCESFDPSTNTNT